ncbi:hypothetical protein M501DRAFT_1004249 [Patellaria atrata CBS 101060]|uniref:Uncharacterized protein n=1 Tax=Patellaria atrata CBS 101060 TaxID=1346257 RepID=A0A9P4VP77_9PEZI|nr:hypothetical protein M501DRAFT_1004249 [Patellaria atrata CBS 101060]
MHSYAEPIPVNTSEPQGVVAPAFTLLPNPSASPPSAVPGFGCLAFILSLFPLLNIFQDCFAFRFCTVPVSLYKHSSCCMHATHQGDLHCNLSWFRLLSSSFSVYPI